VKIHLTYNDDFYRAGYVNVDRFPRNPNQQAGDVFDLDWLVDNGEAVEIVSYNIIDHFQHRFLPDAVKGWARKLAPGGVLTIVAVDAHQVVQKLYTRRIGLSEANALVFGAGDGATRKASFSTLEWTSALMREAGLTIQEQRYEDDRYVVKGKRP
jgi:hypothetical protein